MVRDRERPVLARDDVRDRHGMRDAVDVPELRARLEHGVGIVDALVEDPDRIPTGPDAERVGERALRRVVAGRPRDEVQPDDLGVQVLRHRDQPAEEQRRAVLREPHPEVGAFGEELPARVADVDRERREIALGVLEREGEDLLVLDLVLDPEGGLGGPGPGEVEGHASSSVSVQATAAPHSSRSISKESTRMVSRGR